MFALRLLAALMPVCFVLAADKVMTVHIDGNFKQCNTTHKVGNDTVTIVSKGNIPGANCKLTFNSQDGKCGICFQFEKYAFFNSSMASLDVTAGSKTVMINSMKQFPMESMCSDSSKMIFTLMHESGYVYDPNEPGYMFTLDIYNKCGYRGSAASVSFDDVKDKATGYHHGEEKDNREQQTLITGLVVALCLASIFLVVLLVAYCYVKNSPNRGASKSVGMPKGTKKGMDVGHAEEGRKPDVEMTAYKSKGADRPEGKPLLTGAAVAVALTKEEKKSAKKGRKGSASSASSVSSDDHEDQQAEEKKQLIEPTQETTEPSKDTSEPSAPSGGESGYGGGSSDYTSGGGSSNYTSGGGSSDYTSGGGSSDYTSGGGGYSGGFSSYSSGGGGGGGSSCGGGGSSCGGGGGGGSDD